LSTLKFSERDHVDFFITGMETTAQKLRDRKLNNFEKIWTKNTIKLLSVYIYLQLKTLKSKFTLLAGLQSSKSNIRC